MCCPSLRDPVVSERAHSFVANLAAKGHTLVNLLPAALVTLACCAPLAARAGKDLNSGALPATGSPDNAGFGPMACAQIGANSSETAGPSAESTTSASTMATSDAPLNSSSILITSEAANSSGASPAAASVSGAGATSLGVGLHFGPLPAGAFARICEALVRAAAPTDRQAEALAERLLRAMAAPPAIPASTGSGSVADGTADTTALPVLRGPEAAAARQNLGAALALLAPWGERTLHKVHALAPTTIMPALTQEGGEAGSERMATPAMASRLESAPPSNDARDNNKNSHNESGCDSNDATPFDFVLFEALRAAALKTLQRIGGAAAVKEAAAALQTLDATAAAATAALTGAQAQKVEATAKEAEQQKGAMKASTKTAEKASAKARGSTKGGLPAFLSSRSLPRFLGAASPPPAHALAASGGRHAEARQQCLDLLVALHRSRQAAVAAAADEDLRRRRAAAERARRDARAEAAERRRAAEAERAAVQRRTTAAVAQKDDGTPGESVEVEKGSSGTFRRHGAGRKAPAATVRRRGSDDESDEEGAEESDGGSGDSASDASNEGAGASEKGEAAHKGEAATEEEDAGNQSPSAAPEGGPGESTRRRPAIAVLDDDDEEDEDGDGDNGGGGRTASMKRSPVRRVAVQSAVRAVQRRGLPSDSEGECEDAGGDNSGSGSDTSSTNGSASKAQQKQAIAKMAVQAVARRRRRKAPLLATVRIWGASVESDHDEETDKPSSDDSGEAGKAEDEAREPSSETPDDDGNDTSDSVASPLPSTRRLVLRTESGEARDVSTHQPVTKRTQRRRLVGDEDD